MNNIIPLAKPKTKRVKRNWYIARVHGAAFFARSRTEVLAKYRLWAQAKAAAHCNNVVAMTTRTGSRG